MLKDAIETAIKMETDAITFYGEAADKTRHPFGKQMFMGFVKDETRHLKMLKEILKGLDINPEFVRPRDTVKTVFSELKGEMMERIKALDNEIEAVRIAMNMEKEGFAFYKQSASKAESPKEKDLFERLAVEENDHYSILRETYNFLNDTGNWYMYSEGGVLEG